MLITTRTAIQIISYVTKQIITEVTKQIIIHLIKDILTQIKTQTTTMKRYYNTDHNELQHRLIKAQKGA